MEDVAHGEPGAAIDPEYAAAAGVVRRDEADERFAAEAEREIRLDAEEAHAAAPRAEARRGA